MDIVKTDLGTFVRVKKGEVHYRDKDGNFTGRKVDLFEDIPSSEVIGGLTAEERKTAADAVVRIFAQLFAESDPYKDYIEQCRKAGICKT